MDSDNDTWSNTDSKPKSLSHNEKSKNEDLHIQGTYMVRKMKEGSDDIWTKNALQDEKTKFVIITITKFP